jgi:hypothetical protein
MKKNLQEYASIAEIISAVAIIASLIFVGLQINQNSETVKAQTRNSLTEISRSNTIAALDPRLQSIMFNLTAGIELTPEERMLFYSYCTIIFRSAENAYYQYSVGTFGISEYEGYKNFLRFFFGIKNVEANWGMQKNRHAADFVSEIDALLSETDAAGSSRRRTTNPWTSPASDKIDLSAENTRLKSALRRITEERDILIRPQSTLPATHSEVRLYPQ